MLKVITTYEEFLSLESDWNRLVALRKEHSIFDTFEWNRTWLKHFLNQYELHCLVLHSKSRNLEISNILPLVKTGHKFYLIGALDRDRNLFLVPPTTNDLQILISHISQTPHTHLEFRNLPIQEAWDIKWILEDLHIPNRLIPKKEYVIDPKTFSLESRAVGNEVSRKLRKLERMGAIRYEPIDPKRCSEYLEFLFTHNESRSLDKNYRQRFNDTAYRNWFTEMLENPELGAKPFALTLDDNIIAVEIAFEHCCVFSSYSTAFDPEWFRVSPGILRIPLYVEYGKKHGASTLRLGSGVMGYKQQFTDDYNQLAHLIVFKSVFIDRLFRLRNWLRLIRSSKIKAVLRNGIKTLLFFPLYALSLHRLFEYLNTSRVRILCYHKVNDEDRTPLTVSVANIERQLHYLKQRFTVVPLSQIKNHLLHNDPLPKNAIAITVDDGYIDNYDILFPIIKRMNVPVSIFIVKEYLDNNIKFPWDTERQPALTHQAMKEMLESGLVEFYPHTLTHPILSKLKLEDARKEIIESKQWIEQLLKVISDEWLVSSKSNTNLSNHYSLPTIHYVPDIFAYPSGEPGVDYTEDHERMAREAGFAMAVSVREYSKKQNINIFAVERRIAINEPLWMFRLRCSGVITFIRELFRGKK